MQQQVAGRVQRHPVAAIDPVEGQHRAANQHRGRRIVREGQLAEVDAARVEIAGGHRLTGERLRRDVEVEQPQATTDPPPALVPGRQHAELVRPAAGDGAVLAHHPLAAGEVEAQGVVVGADVVRMGVPVAPLRERQAAAGRARAQQRRAAARQNIADLG
ncbi:MAG: hypothetical protein PGN34_22570 [Methylobacterium frigidaeris]